MNTFFALLLAGTLHTAAPVASPAPATPTYLVNEHMAVWVSNDRKLHVVLGQQQAEADIRLSDEETDYVHQSVKLHQGTISQTYNLSAMPNGAYQLTIRLDQHVIRKTVVVEEAPVLRQITIN